jgi:hypothetical protein
MLFGSAIRIEIPSLISILMVIDLWTKYQKQNLFDWHFNSKSRRSSRKTNYWQSSNFPFVLTFNEDASTACQNLDLQTNIARSQQN